MGFRVEEIDFATLRGHAARDRKMSGKKSTNSEMMFHCTQNWFPWNKFNFCTDFLHLLCDRRFCFLREKVSRCLWLFHLHFNLDFCSWFECASVSTHIIACNNWLINAYARLPDSPNKPAGYLRNIHGNEEICNCFDLYICAVDLVFS